MLLYGRVQFRKPATPTDPIDELCRGGAVSSDCFKSGDSRANEQPGLVAAHIVWVRTHNRYVAVESLFYGLCAQTKIRIAFGDLRGL